MKTITRWFRDRGATTLDGARWLETNTNKSEFDARRSSPGWYWCENVLQPILVRLHTLRCVAETSGDDHLANLSSQGDGDVANRVHVGEEMAGVDLGVRRDGGERLGGGEE